MRDPDLVQRAERAAGALERAWDRWRNMHGLGSEPLAPVSSYVGYSMEEPWGQPRVVFGVAANEAEQLAALLDGHDCYGPVHAEVSARPDWRTAASDAATSAPPVDDHLSIPLQARPPARDMLPPVTPRLGTPELDGTEGKPSESQAGVTDEVGWRGANVAPGDAPIAEVESDESYDPTKPGDQPKSSATGSAGQTADGAESVQARPQVSSQELAPLPPMPDASPSGPMGSASLVPRRLRSRGGKAAAAPSYRAQRFSASPVSYEATQDPAESTPPEAGPSADVAETGVDERADASADAVAADSTGAAETVAAADLGAVSDVVAAADTAADVGGAAADAADAAAPADAAIPGDTGAPADAAAAGTGEPGDTGAQADAADAAAAPAGTAAPGDTAAGTAAPGDTAAGTAAPADAAAAGTGEPGATAAADTPAAAGSAAPADPPDAEASVAAPKPAVAKDPAKAAPAKPARASSAASRQTRARPRPPAKTNRTPR